MDSDKKNETDLINLTKQRIEQEMKGNYWITEGREIENYINIDTLSSILKNDFSSEQRIYKGVFQNRLKKKGTVQFDKVAVASAVVACEKGHPDFTQLDLDLKVNELITFIEKANK